MTLSRALGFGLLTALVGQILAFILAGAGHGWVAPMGASIVLWVAYPLVLARAADIDARGRGPRWLDAAALALAFAADIHLLLATSEEGFGFVQTEHRFAEGFVELWLVIWAAWQLIALRNFLSAGKRRDRRD